MRGKILVLSALYAILAGFVFSQAAWSKTYKWTDDSGTTHYSQVPPTGYSAEEITVEASPGSPTTERAETADKVKVEQKPNVKEADSDTKVDAGDGDKLAQMREENCLNAKHNLMVLETNTRVRVKEGDDYRVLDATEQESRASKLRQQIDELCG